MNELLEYNGYIGSAEVDSENGVLVGRLLYIRDAIGYEADTVPALVSAFREAVDDYLAACKEDGTEPDVPCKGSFNVRVGPERHRKAAIAARIADVSLNDFVAQAIDNALEPRAAKVVYNHQWVTMVGEHRTASTGDPEKLTTLTLVAAPLSVGSDVKH
jgi:predicted HicB family RNase H-like nuclease